MSVYITCSRKSTVISKRFVKYLIKFIPDLKYIPRGNTNLNNIFKKLEYFGVTYFVVCFTKDLDFLLRIYKFTKEGYMIDKEYIFKVIDLRHLVPFKKIEENKFSFFDQKKIFYFIDNKFKSKEENYGLFSCKNKLEQEDSKNVLEFRLDGNYLGFKLELLNCDYK
jgi:hypothetical protein